MNKCSVYIGYCIGSTQQNNYPILTKILADYNMI